MPQPLYAVPFALEDRELFADFFCGDEPWSLAAAEWICGSGVEKSLTQPGSQVWLYRRESDDQLVGFGSLGRTRRRWPPPSGQYANLLIIPQLAVDARFRGQPANDPPRYSHQILGHLIAEARDVAVDTGSPLLLLYVHEQNGRAMRLYEEFDFVADKTARSDNFVMMTHRLIA